MPHNLFLSTFSISPDNANCSPTNIPGQPNQPGNAGEQSTPGQTDQASPADISARIEKVFAWMQHQPSLHIEWRRQGLNRTLTLTDLNHKMIGQGDTLLLAGEQAMKNMKDQ